MENGEWRVRRGGDERVIVWELAVDGEKAGSTRKGSWESGMDGGCSSASSTKWVVKMERPTGKDGWPADLGRRRTLEERVLVVTTFAGS